MKSGPAMTGREKSSITDQKEPQAEFLLSPCGIFSSSAGRMRLIRFFCKEKWMYDLFSEFGDLKFQSWKGS